MWSSLMHYYDSINAFNSQSTFVRLLCIKHSDFVPKQVNKNTLLDTFVAGNLWNVDIL